MLNFMCLFIIKTARSLVHCQGYALMQMFNYYYYINCERRWWKYEGWMIL